MKTIAVDKSSPKDIPEKYIISAKRTLEMVEDGSAIVTPITDDNAL
ncbi:MAG: hypothetical protein ACI9Y1_001138 [Lentisphaeria bacterium]|jgi:hypothetical protein